MRIALLSTRIWCAGDTLVKIQTTNDLSILERDRLLVRHQTRIPEAYCIRVKSHGH